MKQTMVNRLGRFLPFLFFMAIILWIIWEADLGRYNQFIEMGKKVPLGDKIGHFMAYGFLAYLLNYAFRGKKFNIGQIQLYKAVVLVLGFAIAEEFSQLAFQERSFDLVDILFDILGVMAFMIIYNSVLLFMSLSIEDRKIFFKNLRKGLF